MAMKSYQCQQKQPIYMLLQLEHRIWAWVVILIYLLFYYNFRFDRQWCRSYDRQTDRGTTVIKHWSPDVSTVHHKAASTGPGSRESQRRYGWTSPVTTAFQELHIDWGIMLELRHEGGHALADSGWSCNSAAVVQNVTSETQVCSLGTWWPVRVWAVEIYKIANVLWFLKHAGFYHSSGDLLANINHCLLNGSAVNWY